MRKVNCGWEVDGMVDEERKFINDGIEFEGSKEKSSGRQRANHLPNGKLQNSYATLHVIILYPGTDSWDDDIASSESRNLGSN
jgi:hypothetical protein